MRTRRQILHDTAAITATTLILPGRAGADAHGGDTYQTANGAVTVHPVSHASLLLETPRGVIYVDPVGGADRYAGFPPPDLVLITHEHGDHFEMDTLGPVTAGTPHLVTNPAVGGMVPSDLTPEVIANGDSIVWNDIRIDAIPAYNTTEGRLNFHPQGRDNGYVLTLDDFRIYISGDTEDIPEMRALEGIDLAFVCMNLPFTMDALAASDAVREFRPGVVYPYHYRGRDNGTQDPGEFSEMLADVEDVTVAFGDWYS